MSFILKMCATVVYLVETFYNVFGYFFPTTVYSTFKVTEHLLPGEQVMGTPVAPAALLSACVAASWLLWQGALTEL